MMKASIRKMGEIPQLEKYCQSHRINRLSVKDAIAKIKDLEKKYDVDISYDYYVAGLYNLREAIGITDYIGKRKDITLTKAHDIEALKRQGYIAIFKHGKRYGIIYRKGEINLP